MFGSTGLGKNLKIDDMSADINPASLSIDPLASYSRDFPPLLPRPSPTSASAKIPFSDKESPTPLPATDPRTPTVLATAPRQASTLSHEQALVPNSCPSDPLALRSDPPSGPPTLGSDLPSSLSGSLAQALHRISPTILHGQQVPPAPSSLLLQAPFVLP
ncbi:hypothetical protein MRB53_005083 [Persea americana]|uniref:Uncharacterized protein n=1 Tax=Persea americana TaxID=3435 RepID=A0ACC2MCE9_PERAE|nr:hypothetical protein MRB53_005083 [Persea americana]